jgi:putative transcriptional regulator
MSTLNLRQKMWVFKRDVINGSYSEGILMPTNKNQKSSFGKRLKSIRQARGLTQEELAERLGIERRMVAHYENYAKFPSVDLIPKLAKALKVSVEELLGTKEFKDEDLAKNKNLMRRFCAVGNLPLRDQRTVFSLINALKAKHAPKTN